MPPRLLLRAEGLVLFADALAVYLERDYGLLLAVLVFLAPDVSFAGYAAGPRVGAIAYNALHTTVGPLVVGTIGFLVDADLAVRLALVWLGHIGFDRALGYGLKYATAFTDTHLARV